MEPTTLFSLASTAAALAFFGAGYFARSSRPESRENELAEEDLEELREVPISGTVDLQLRRSLSTGASSLEDLLSAVQRDTEGRLVALLDDEGLVIGMGGTGKSPSTIRPELGGLVALLGGPIGQAVRGRILAAPSLAFQDAKLGQVRARRVSWETGRAVWLVTLDARKQVSEGIDALVRRALARLVLEPFVRAPRGLAEVGG